MPIEGVQPLRDFMLEFVPSIAENDVYLPSEESLGFTSTSLWTRRERHGVHGASPDRPAAVSGLSIGDDLIRRLREAASATSSASPAITCSVLRADRASPLRVIGCTREDCAGFVADAYAASTASAPSA